MAKMNTEINHLFLEKLYKHPPLTLQEIFWSWQAREWSMWPFVARRAKPVRANPPFQIKNNTNVPPQSPPPPPPYRMYIASHP